MPMQHRDAALWCLPPYVECSLQHVGLGGCCIPSSCTSADCRESAKMQLLVACKPCTSDLEYATACLQRCQP